MTNQPPLMRFRTKGTSITVWPGKNGGYQCTVKKEYKPKDSAEWKQTSSFFPDELEALEKLCADARAWIHKQAESSKHEEAKANGYQPAPSFEDDDIPF